MDKGVTVADVTRGAHAFRQAGVLVHAYLMYGFPGQTEVETLESMERVRLLFRAGLLSSAFWHRFVFTEHSGIASDPLSFGVKVKPLPPGAFATNDREHIDLGGTDHDPFDEVLPRALAAWMRGRELERPAHSWFDSSLPPAPVTEDFIQDALAEPMPVGSRLIWLGGEPLETPQGLVVHHARARLQVDCTPEEAHWLAEVLEASRPGAEPLSLDEARSVFPGDWPAFSEQWAHLRELALLLI